LFPLLAPGWRVCWLPAWRAAILAGWPALLAAWSGLAPTMAVVALVGVVLSGGASSRMGRPKALLDLAGRPFVRRVADTLHEAGIAKVVVVVGSHEDEIRAALGAADRAWRDEVLVNPYSARGQLSSLWIALDWIETPPRLPGDGVVVALVDHPLVRPDTVRALVGAFAASGRAVVRPVFRGRHGHPVIFARSTFASLRAAPPGEGARAVVRSLGPAVLDVEVDDEGVVTDVDTPEDYARVTGGRS
jgi:molybdenum cofactor cytidylyltransferase